MLNFILVVITCASFSYAQEGEILVPDNKTQCINQMIQWCNEMQYPQQGAGLAILSVTYEDPKGYYRVFCSCDSDGTNCTRNGNPWVACTPDHVLIYKGEAMTEASANADDDVCKTADKIFNELFIQNLRYDNTTMKAEIQKSLEAFFKQLAMMDEQLGIMKDMMSKPSDFWGGFNDGFPFQRPGMTTATPRGDQTSTKETNQIERE